MTLKLIILAAALSAISGCAASPHGDSPGYDTNNSPRDRGFDSRDAGDRDYPVGHELREYNDERNRN